MFTGGRLCFLVYVSLLGCSGSQRTSTSVASGAIVGEASSSCSVSSALGLGGVQEIVKGWGVRQCGGVPPSLLREWAHPSWVIDGAADHAAKLLGGSACAIFVGDEYYFADEGSPVSECVVVGRGGVHVYVPGWVSFATLRAYVFAFDEVKALDGDRFVEVA